MNLYVDEFSDIKTYSNFDYPEFVCPPFPADFPTAEQMVEWGMADDPLWKSLRSAFRDQALSEYKLRRRAAFEAFQAAQQAAKKPKGKVKAVEPAIPLATPPTAPVQAAASKNPRPTPQACPAALTGVQVTFWDNGVKEKNYGADGKRKNGGGQFKVTVQAYTGNMGAPGFNFINIDWFASFVMRGHGEVRRSLSKWLKAGTISPDYHAALTQSLKDTAARSASTMIGMFWSKANGSTYFDGQYVVLDVEHALVNYGIMYLGANVAPIPLVFDHRQCDGERFAGNARSQARYDVNGSKPSWLTCPN